MIDEIATIMNSNIDESFLDGLVKIGVIDSLKLTILETGPKHKLIKELRQLKKEWEISLYQTNDPVKMSNEYYLHSHRLGRGTNICSIRSYF